MKFSESWLRTLVNPSWNSTQLAEQLTMAGIEVEALQSVAPPFSGVVVAQVLSAEKHPEADRLKVLSVDVGQEVPLQIVCGAGNVVVGMKAPCAMVGAILPGGFKIKDAKLRGVASFGMMCSEKELGLKEEADGLMVLSSDAPVGQDIRQYLHLDDQLLTLKLTPNRADCLSILGVAREVAALSGQSLTYSLPAIQPISSISTREVVNHAQEACPLYVGRRINLSHPHAATPSWMMERLERSGIRSRGIVVDITNYVLLEMGQPLHAFDNDKIEGNVQIRFALENEKITLLNEQEVSLSTDMLVIADDKKPLAIAGIMGGLQSSVTDDTKQIFLEAAFFSPQAIAGRARRLNLSTDSSHRFERGVDFASTQLAIERTTELLLNLCGGEAGPLIISQHTLPQRKSCLVRKQRIERVLGIAVEIKTIETLLGRLGLALVAVEEGFLVTPPAYRFDLVIEEDYIEEIARLIGYDNIPEHAPVGTLNMLPQPEGVYVEAHIQDLLVARDYQEAITYSFVDEKSHNHFVNGQQNIALLNPIASHLSVMRSSIWPGLIQALQVNIAKQADRVRLFEMGRCFYKDHTGEVKQPKKLALLCFGNRYQEQWGEKTRKVDFFDLKADIEALINNTDLSFKVGQHPSLHPGRQAEIMVGQQVIGLLGELHPQLVGEFDLPAPCLLAEIELDLLPSKSLTRYFEPSKYPQVKRDVAVLVDENIAVGQLIESLKALVKNPVQDIFLFDLYRGVGVGEGKKSLAFRIVIQDTEKTLTENDIDQVVAGVLSKLQSEFQAELR
ncbi:MAG: phenylalanine--tRNA ligase subunit beta [Betaproteobacteria bacterium]|nr:phenylalanine--tRNA ligase subunit beta [Betaproteobacteria bacterium]MDE2056541.1 phenylalanine--tRNA ligase subunit beta [Betaproteobacteria bacterium]